MRCGILAFLHVPKSAGSTVTRHLQQITRGVPSNGWSELTISTEANHTWPDVLQLAREQKHPRWIVIHHVDAAPPGMLSEAFRKNILVPLECTLRAKGCRLLRATVLRNAHERASSAAFYNKVPHCNYSSWVAEHATDGILSFVLHNRLRLRRHNETHRMTSEDLLQAQEALGEFDIVGRSEQLGTFLQAIDMLLPARLTTSSGMQPLALAARENPTPSAQKYELTNEEQAFTMARTVLDQELVSTACDTRWCATRSRCAPRT